MRALLLFSALSVSACATQRIEPVPVQPVAAAIVPVALGDLKGSEALIFPDIGVSAAIAGADTYGAQCLPQYRRVGEPHGFALRQGAGEPFLRVMVATVSESSALGLGGTGVTPELKEAVAESVQGRLRCAP